MDVLVDTSVWVDFLRPGSEDSSSIETLDRLLENDQAIVTGPVVTELLRGVRSDSQRRQLQSLLSSVRSVDVVSEDWASTGELLAKLQKKGITLPTIDGLIATVANRVGTQVLTSDKHFDHLEIKLFDGGR